MLRGSEAIVPAYIEGLGQRNKLSEVVMWYCRLLMSLPKRLKRKVFSTKIFAPVRHEKLPRIRGVV